MTLNKYADQVVRDFVRDITDHVFRHIKDDAEYKRQVQDHSRKAVNSLIGKKVKTALRLGNDRRAKSSGGRIKSYTIHKPPA